MKIIKHSDNIYLIPKQYTGCYDYKFDGKEIGHIEGLLPLQFDHVPTVEEIHKTAEVDFYQHTDGSTKTREEYEAQSKELYKGDEDGNWSSVDDEFAYRKFIDGWKAVYHEVIGLVPVQLVLLYGDVRSEFEDIIPIYLISEDVKGDLFQWIPDFRQYVIDVAKKYGFIDAGYDVGYNATKGRKYSFGRQESIEYMTVNGSYASFLYESQSLRVKTRMGTYDELVKARESSIAMIDSYFAREYQKTNESKINNIGAVISQLALIGDAVRKIDPKMKSLSEKRIALGKINSLIEELSK